MVRPLLRWVFSLPLLAALLCSCAARQTQPDAPPAEEVAQEVTPAPEAPRSSTVPSEQLTEERAMQTHGGARFTAPARWWVHSDAERILLEDPDRELVLSLVEVAAAGVEEAVALAWTRVVPGFEREVEHRVVAPGRGGWDEIVQFAYRTTTEEKRTVLAVARRKAQVWYVVLVDSATAAMDRRGAQLMTVLTSFKPDGLDEESFAGAKAHPLDSARAGALEEFIRRAMADAGLPGAAVAVVQDGKVVFEAAFGVRELGKPAQVTPRTLFMIGSANKALTSLMMAKLVDEGRFGWDTKVTDLFPSFALADAEATAKLQMQHTLCACTGLPRQDLEFLFEFEGTTPESLVASMRQMSPTTGFGETFQYSNLLVSTGGFVAALAADKRRKMGPAYDAVMQSRVFDPVGMKATTMSTEVARRRDHAVPHGMELTASYQPLPYRIEGAVQSVRPAGGAWSNVRDMARWLMVEINGGLTPEGKRVASEDNVLARRAPRATISSKAHYGLGLIVGEAAGVQTVGHNGNTLGFTADAFFLPEHRVGMVVLANAAGANSFHSAVRRRLMELLFDGREEAKENLATSLSQRKEMLQQVVGRIQAPDPEWIKPFLGTWRQAGLGQVSVQAKGSDFVFDAGEWSTRLGQKVEPDGSRKLVFTSPPLAGLEVLATFEEDRPVLVIQAPQQRYVFERLVEGASSPPSTRR